MLEIFHDSSRNLMVYKTDRVDYICDHVSQAERINGHCVAVPINLFNLQLCRRLELPVVPIMHDYDWPHAPDRSPLPHQKIMANFMVLHPYSFNLSDMGTMKTLATLWAADWLMRQHEKGTFRALIVAPLSTLERTWADTIFSNFLGSRSYRVVYGSAEARRKLLREDADFYIINFDGVGVGAHNAGKRRFIFSGVSEALIQRRDIRLCVIDEAGAYSDSTTRRHYLARAILKRAYLWLLTGTPTPNYPTDAYGLAKLVNDAFGESFTSFKRRSMIQVSQYKWLPARDGYTQARRLLVPSIRFDIKDVWNGPELTTQQRSIMLSDQQRTLIRLVRDKLGFMLKSGQTITPANEAAVRSKILQIVLGAVYDDNHVPVLLDSTPRLKELDWVLQNASRGKIIILAPFTSVVQLLYKHIKLPTAMVTGATSKKDRDEIFRAFQQDDDPRVIVADPQPVAEGLDLFAAQTVLWYGPTDKARLYGQANKRAHRPGQKFPVTVVQFASTPLEREIFRRLENRQDAQGALLDMVRKGIF